MVWWLGIHLPMWETHVRSLVEELRSHIPWDPLNPWTPTTEPECPRACVPQQKESFYHSWRKPACSKEQRQCSQKKKKKSKVKCKVLRDILHSTKASTPLGIFPSGCLHVCTRLLCLEQIFIPQVSFSFRVDCPLSVFFITTPPFLIAVAFNIMRILSL